MASTCLHQLRCADLSVEVDYLASLKADGIPRSKRRKLDVLNFLSGLLQRRTSREVDRSKVILELGPHVRFDARDKGIPLRHI